jgi:hypothetical protein
MNINKKTIKRSLFMQHVKYIKTLSIALLLSCGMQMNAMDVDQYIEDGFGNGWYYNPNVCTVQPIPLAPKLIRPVQPKTKKLIKLLPIAEGNSHGQERSEERRKEKKKELTSWWLEDAQPKAKANDPFKIKILNQSEAPCVVQLPFYDPYPLPAIDVKQHEDYVAYVVKPKSQILIRYLNNIYTLRMALSNLGNGRELSELVLEHQGTYCKGFIPNPVVMQATTTLYTKILLNGQAENGTPIVLLRDANEVVPVPAPIAIVNDNNQQKLVKEPKQKCPICLENLKQNDPDVERYCNVCTGKMHASCFASIKKKFDACPTCGLSMNH